MSAKTRFSPVPTSRVVVLTVLFVVVALIASEPGLAQSGRPASLPPTPRHEPRNFDARVAAPPANAAAAPLWRTEIDTLRAQMPDLEIGVDPVTGATKSLWNAVGYLTDRDSRVPLDIADSYVASHVRLLGLLDTDIADREVTDVVHSRVTGATHIYYRQRINGIPVYNAQLHVNVSRDGRILGINNSFLPALASAYNTLQPAISAVDAVGHAAHHLEVRDVEAVAVSPRNSPNSSTREATRDVHISAPRLSSDAITATPMLLPIRRGEARLVWNFQVQTHGSEHAYDLTVDAESGRVWTRFDWISSDQYKVYRAPTESPAHASPAAPADGRTTVSQPHQGVASPFGWHDTNGAPGPEFTGLRGNNVYAYDDRANIDRPTGPQPDCGASLNCSFPLDLAQEPAAYTAASITNVFYWTNLIHDVQYQYGFDEAAGNFQMNNYGRGGRASDELRAETQDAGGFNNANMFTPPDGQRPRLQLYLWVLTNPERDGGLDNGIIVHEYGHGISRRLVGGPSNSSCMNNLQQPGEGLSDWWMLVYTARPGDTGPQRRGIATYGLDQPNDGDGVRDLPYSTDTSINPWTYASIAGLSIPHGVGSVWAQGMWRVYWALVDRHGFGVDLYNASGGYGNQRAMLYVNEGLKNTACSPTFTQVRDGIIQAAIDNYGGEDVCRLWDAFAAFGLGVDAVSGDANNTTPVDGFNKPVACGGTPPPSFSINDVSVVEGHSGATAASFTVSLSNASPTEARVTYATSDGSAFSGGFASAEPITVPGDGTGSFDGSPAGPYPSTLSVSGVNGVIQSVKVRLAGVSHTLPEEMDILLVGPTGQRVMLMSDAGGPFAADRLDLTFQDGASSLTWDRLASGTYAPTDLGELENMPSPAPGRPYASSLSRFDGTNPNGTWRLYVSDDAAGDVGSIEGWSIILTVATVDFTPQTGQLVFPSGTTSQTVVVNVQGDRRDELDETFSVNLSLAVSAEIADGQGIGTIVNDDVPAVPPGAATLRPLTFIGLKPIFEWFSVPGSSWYQLWITDSTGPRLARWVSAEQAGCADGQPACAFASPVTLNPGQVYWWIQTWNSRGFGPWSAAGTFYAAPERIVLGLGPGGGGELQSWSGNPSVRQATLQLPWPEYDANGGELHPAAGDVDGDGLDEIVVGLGFGGQGFIAVFDDADHGHAFLTWLQLPWPAYNIKSGEIWPAVGDLDGDGREEIVAGLGPPGEGYFAIFDDGLNGYAFQTWGRVSWAAYNQASQAETHPAVVNVDGDSRAEIVIGLGIGGGGFLEVFDDAIASFAHKKWLRVSWGAYNAGAAPTYPAGGDVDGDGYDEIVVGLGAKSAGWVEVFDDFRSGHVHAAWLQTSWSEYNQSNGETHPAVGNLDGDAAMEIVIGLSNSRWFEARDDLGAAYASLGWNQIVSDAEAMHAREPAGAFPAIGRFRFRD